jgi:hypothetical protein
LQAFGAAQLASLNHSTLSKTSAMPYSKDSKHHPARFPELLAVVAHRSGGRPSACKA